MSRAPTLHICNTFFESELESPIEKPLAAWMDSHKIVRKLQTLPLQYAAPVDLVLVSELMNAPLKVGRIEDWGASRAIDAWAKERNIPYSMPDWETVRTVNSKIFSFSHSPKLPLASLLYNETEVLDWIERVPGRKVLKTPFGTAGRGHFHIPGIGNLSAFLKREFAKNYPIIGEPWVERILDFSTQWKDSVLLGATVFENSEAGSYRSTLTGPAHEIFASYHWALVEHLAIAKPILEKVRKLGFFGNLGIDAFVYRWEGKERLQPIVEINGRKTMSWAALQIQEKHFPRRRLRFNFSPEQGISISQN
jgi:hypothetical protein